MALNFPNAVRSFDQGRSCISFWGSDTSREVAFQIEIEALHSLRSGTVEGESQFLAVFDDHRDAILKVAAAAYARQGGSYHRITAADLARAR